MAWGRNDSGQSTIPAGLNGVIAIAAGYEHSLALKSDGTVVAWGTNYHGQCTVPAGLSGVTAVAAGGNHSLALKSDGTVVGWGDYIEGWMPTNLNGVVAIAAGFTHNLVLKSDGTMVAWGSGFYGQGSVPAGLNRVVAIGSGGFHNLALKSDGTVVAWGWSYYGATTVPAGVKPVTALAAGRLHSLALKSAGAADFLSAVVAWGATNYGQIAVPAGLTAVAAIDAGDLHNLALKSDGTVIAWGANSFGQSTVPAGLSRVAAIAAGGSHSLALQSNGTVVAWGYNGYGQCTIPAGLNGVTAIAAGGRHSLALKNDGTVVAWGRNDRGQSTVPTGLSGVVGISAGEDHSLALKADGTVVAWGYNGYGQCTVPTGLSRVVSISAGEGHNLALKSDGTVVAWGWNLYGQCTVPPGMRGVIAISAGAYHSLAITNSVAPITTTVQTSPAGRSFIVDGTNYTTTQTFTWSSGSSHTIATTSPQGGGAGVQYLWNNWSDGGAVSHTVAPISGTTFTVGFTTQYYLTMNAGAGGTVSPASGWRNSAAVVPINATANSGYNFSNWAGSGSGSYSGTSSSASVTMNGPITETANFAVPPVYITVTVQTSPSGRSFTVDGTNYTTTQTFTWILGSSHTIATTSPQSELIGVQYVWNNWSDGGAISHTVSPTSDAIYTANFNPQYYLTMRGGAGGSVSPGSGWRNSEETVPINVTAINIGYVFNSWVGRGIGSYSGNSSSASVIMNEPITETAVFMILSDCATLLTPGEGETLGSGVTPQFNWLQSYPVADWFRLYISRNGSNYLDFWCEANALTSTNTWIPTNLFPAGNYSWCIQIWRASSGLGPWSSVGHFTVQACIPAALTPISPQATIEPGSVIQYTWGGDHYSPCATWYELCIYTNGTLIFDEWYSVSELEFYNVIPGGFFQYTVSMTPPKSGVYTWWVRGWGPDGMGPWSSGMTFTNVLNPAGTVTLLSPLYGEVVSSTLPQFSWQNNGSASCNWLWLYRNGSVYCSEWLEGTNSWIPTNNLPTGNYTWWLGPWNADGFGTWASSSFTVPLHIPGTITLLGPNGILADTSLMPYTWVADPNASWYELAVFRNGAAFFDHWYSVSSSTPQEPNQFRVQVSQSHGPGNYTWWVRGWSADGMGPWGPAACPFPFRRFVSFRSH